MTSPAAQRTPRFQFDRDTFAFANELVWEYRLDPGAGTMTTFCNDPPPAYTHRCFVMARSARQFWHHARFDPSLPVADAGPHQNVPVTPVVIESATLLKNAAAGKTVK